MSTEFTCPALVTKNVSHWASIQGNIGGGKSTLLARLCLLLKQRRLLALDADAHDDGRDLWLPLDEPVDDWLVAKYARPRSSSDEDERMHSSSGGGGGGDEDKISMLDLYYSDKAEYSFTFQVLAFTTRLRNLTRALEQVPERASRPRIILLSERDFLTDWLFFYNLYRRGFVRQCDYDNYNGFFDMIARPLLRFNTMMVHVPTLPDECMRRIVKRNRLGEVDRVTLADLESLEQDHQLMKAGYGGAVYVVEEFHVDMSERQLELVAERVLATLSDAVLVQ